MYIRVTECTFKSDWPVTDFGKLFEFGTGVPGGGQHDLGILDPGPSVFVIDVTVLCIDTIKDKGLATKTADKRVDDSDIAPCTDITSASRHLKICHLNAVKYTAKLRLN